jgi:hypothetical protein
LGAVDPNERFGDRGMVREFRLVGEKRQSGGGNETAAARSEHKRGRQRWRAAIGFATW